MLQPRVDPFIAQSYKLRDMSFFVIYAIIIFLNA